jgi:hypothetical protein
VNPFDYYERLSQRYLMQDRVDIRKVPQPDTHAKAIEIICRFCHRPLE